MGVRTSDIFGNAGGSQPAEPGSYGEVPSGYRLPDATRLGPVHLQVADLARSLDFYERVLGFRTVRRDAAHAVLAAHGDDTPLVELHERQGTRPAASRGPHVRRPRRAEALRLRPRRRRRRLRPDGRAARRLAVAARRRRRDARGGAEEIRRGRAHAMLLR